MSLLQFVLPRFRASARCLRAAFAVLAVLVLLVQARPAAAQDPLEARPSVRAWLAEAERLARESDREAALEHVRRIDPAFDEACGVEDVFDAGGGSMDVYRTSSAERLVTVSCDLGAVLANQTLVFYRVRLGPAGSTSTRDAVVRLAVPAWGDGQVVYGSTASGIGTFDARRRTYTVVNRCCAGAEGITTTYRLPPDAAARLALVRVEAWTMDERGRIVRRVVHYPARQTPRRAPRR